ncbi:transposase [Sphingomonas sp. H160509]|uniref:transposase n=1 Tax=Sphingomonas sp. H160509 TaxID=2955313 RepID=UPI00406CF843
MKGFGPLFGMLADRIEALLADKGYDADAIRQELARADVEAVIPTKSNRRIPIPHDREKYRWRNLVERLFSKLKNWPVSQRVMTRQQSHISASSRLHQLRCGRLCPRGLARFPHAQLLAGRTYQGRTNLAQNDQTTRRSSNRNYPKAILRYQ